MKKLTKALIPVAVAAALTACAPEKEAPQPMSPPPGVASLNPAAKTFLPATLAQIFTEIAPEIENLDHGFYEITNPEDFSDKDIEHAGKLKDGLKTVFPQNRMRNLMRFSDEYFDSVIDQVSIYVARACECHPVGYKGFFSNSDEHVQIVVSTAKEGMGPQDAEYINALNDVMTLLHEVGHRLGLGERLAQYFAEKVMGLEVTSPIVQKYNTMYDRELEQRMGEREFWKMAFSTEAKYEQAWNKYMKDIMPYREFLDVLSVVDMLNGRQFVQNEHDSHPVLQLFPEEENIRMYDIRNFHALFQDYTNINGGLFKEGLRELFSEYAEKMHTIAETESIDTDRAILDGYRPPNTGDVGIMDIVEYLSDTMPPAYKMGILLCMLIFAGQLPLETLKKMSGKKEKYINFSRNGIRVIEKDNKSQ